MAESLTLVLPVHNAEATLSRQVDDLLAIASELTSQFELLVIDDGSVDDTYEIASELATRFPQIRVIRHGDHRGLGPTLRSLRGRVKSEVVIVQDGTSVLDAAQVRRLWAERFKTQLRLDTPENPGQAENCLEDLRSPSQIHSAMEAAHRRLLSRQESLPGGNTLSMAGSLKQPSLTPKAAARARTKESDVGRIPQLPSASLFNSVSEFARSE